MAFDQIWLIDNYPNHGCGSGPNMFSSDALALTLTLSVFLFFLLPLETLGSETVEVSESCEHLRTFLWCVSPTYCVFTVASF